jgi:general secretion pathway protein J
MKSKIYDSRLGAQRCCGFVSRLPSPVSRLFGFTLIELLVALTIFSIMSALAYGGLNSIAHTRSALGQQEDAFRDLMRAVTMLDRDLREVVARPVRGNFGQQLPAFAGAADHVEFTRLGFANPQAEPRSNLERVLYELDAGTLKRGRYAVLDRAPTTAPTVNDLNVRADDLRLHYLDASNHWLEAWPPPQATDPTLLPRAVQWRLRTHDDGEIEGTVQLVSPWPPSAAEASGLPGGPPVPIRPVKQ